MLIKILNNFFIFYNEKYYSKYNYVVLSHTIPPPTPHVPLLYHIFWATSQLNTRVSPTLMRYDIMPNSCTRPSHPPFFLNNLSLSEYQYISRSITLVKHKMRYYVLTLIVGTFGLNLLPKWFMTSATNCWCFKVFLIFIILTIAACMKVTQ